MKTKEQIENEVLVVKELIKNLISNYESKKIAKDAFDYLFTKYTTELNLLYWVLNDEL